VFVTVAFAGTTDINPKPKAETATSAMRLRVVFVDICFLSLKVDPEAFPRSAWLRKGFSSDMSEFLTCSYGMSASFCAA
jgi:hypothetical protein